MKSGRKHEHSRRAFTLVELMVAMSMTAVLLVAVLFAVILLQHSYVATESYATAQADQARLLDALALDLRRAVPTAAGTPPYAMDPDGQGLKINVPDYYRFSASDPQHLSPVAVRPSYDPTTGTSYYSSGTPPAASGAPPYRTIAYRFNATDGSITRSDPWQPLVRCSSNRRPTSATPSWRRSRSISTVRACSWIPTIRTAASTARPATAAIWATLPPTAKLINANHAQVYGDAATDDGSVRDADKVTGQQSSNFYQESTPYTAGMLSPVWIATPDTGTLTTDAAYVAGTDPNNPTRVRLDGINLPDGNHTIHLTAPPTPPPPKGSPPGTPATAPSYMKVYIDGDLITNGTSAIEVDSGVNVIFYITGNVSLTGVGLLNDSQVAGHVLINGIEPTANPDGTLPPRSITVATDQDFEGVIFAPNHDIDLNMIAAVVAGGPPSPPGPSAKPGAPPKPPPPPTGPKHLPPAPPTPGQNNDHAAGYNGIDGAFVGNTITVEASTPIHNDQTLRTAGPVNHYEIANWFEDNLGRDSSAFPEQFWWTTASK